MIKVILRERKSGDIGLYKLEMKYLGTIVKFIDGYAGCMSDDGGDVAFMKVKNKEEAIKKACEYFNDKEDWEI